MKYIILQLPNSNPAKFMGTDFVEEHCGGIPKREDYVLVYSGQTFGYGNLDQIYERLNVNRPTDYHTHSLSLSHIYELLNVNRPADYHARSLSVSDVIGLEVSNKQWEWWYVDSIGFKRIWR